MYNALTGRSEKIGNWAGVTVDKKESPIKKEHLNFPDKEPLWYTLPQEGKTLEVVERVDDDYKVWSTYYKFDGQNLKFAGHEQ